MLNSSYDYLSFIFLSFRYISMLTVIILLIEISTCNFYFNNNIFTKSSYNNIRLVFSRFLDLHRNLEIVKEKATRKTCFFREKSAYLHASTKQNFAWRRFFEANGISYIFTRNRFWNSGEYIWKGLITKAL